MRLPAWAGPLSIGLACAAAFAVAIWLAYQALMWFAGLLLYALIGMFVIGYGLDPMVIAA